MNCAGHQNVTADHLRRDAYLYVRQSTLRQVLENTESTQRQYAPRQQAVALGWPTERVVVIDSDLGQSGASVADREGFQRLVTEVSLGRAGIVLGLEVSRLARNNADWHRLLEICALSDTLILDEDGLYDPSHFNDRLLLAGGRGHATSCGGLAKLGKRRFHLKTLCHVGRSPAHAQRVYSAKVLASQAWCFGESENRSGRRPFLPRNSPVCRTCRKKWRGPGFAWPASRGAIALTT